ncbi:MAG: hypothetical protein WAO00_00650 [Chthoniobacterales bacterium]
MAIVEAETYSTLRSAVDSPETYSTGEERRELRAAFDIACSQIAHHVFKFEAPNQRMLRRKLNNEKNIPEKFRELIKLLKKALAASEPLKSKEYSDDDEETVDFIESELKLLVKCLRAFI